MMVFVRVVAVYTERELNYALKSSHIDWQRLE